MTDSPRPLAPPRPLPPPQFLRPLPLPWYLPPASSGRSLAPDLARGMMLLLIACANSISYLWGHRGSMLSAHPTDGSALDKALQAVMAVAVDARIYPMFALLFGYGMVQLARSRVGRGLPPAAIKQELVRRHGMLILFGFLHALLLFAGDVLSAYGLVGLVLVALFFDRADRVLRTWLIIFGCLIVAGGLGSVAMGALLWWVLAQDPSLAAVIGSDPMGFTFADVVSGHSNYFVAMLWRIGIWLMSAPAAMLALAVPAMVLLGWLAARRGILEHPEQHRGLLRRVAVIGLAVGWLGGVPSALQHLGLLELPEAVSWTLPSLSAATGPFAGVGYAATFALIAARKPQPGRISGPIAALGRRSLSGYLWQSIVMAPLLAAWGFGVGARVGVAEVLAIAFSVWLVSVLIAAQLEARGKPGPFDALLRRLVARPRRPRG